MPFKNEHSARQMDPSLFQNFRRWTTPELEGKGVFFILGLQGETSLVQSVRGSAEKLTLDEFKTWLIENDFEVDAMEEAVSKGEAEKAVPQKYSHINLDPPKAVRENAREALEVRETMPPSRRGMTPVGLARARDLMNGRPLSPETIRRMFSYLSRHEIDKEGSTWDQKGKGWQAWNGWGGDEALRWARRVVDQMNRADEEEDRS